jgi:hypothetical protein
MLGAELALAGDVAFDAARAEGHRTRDDFKAAWVRRHDRAWVDRQEAWATGPDELLSDEVLVERFDQRHAERPVWALFFEVDRAHVPRLLHRQSERGYTTTPRDAVPDEPEAVDAATQTRITAEARRRDTMRRGWLDQHLLDERASLEQRLDRARELARQRGIDVRQDVRIIERRIAAIERKATRQDAA